MIGVNLDLDVYFVVDKFVEYYFDFDVGINSYELSCFFVVDVFLCGLDFVVDVVGGFFGFIVGGVYFFGLLSEDVVVFIWGEWL